MTSITVRGSSLTVRMLKEIRPGNARDTSYAVRPKAVESPDSNRSTARTPFHQSGQASGRVNSVQTAPTGARTFQRVVT